MLAAIIRIENNNYYVELEQRNGKKAFRVVLANNNETRVLSHSEVQELMNTILSSDMTFKEHTDDYDIYIDEAGNKRFFKDGKEDYQMFYENNGTPEIMADNKSDRMNKKPLAKRFKFQVKKAMIDVILVSQISLAAIVTSDYLVDNVHITKEGIFLEGEATYDVISDYIENSNSKLNNSQRKYLDNEDFISDVVNIADDSRNYILKRKTKNIGIEYDYDLCSALNISGYYNSTQPNKIYLMDDSSEIQENSLAHEFVHLMQDYNEYYYIKEACAEQMAYEYFDSEPQSYRDLWENVAILIEMIGPKPIMDLNFKGDVSSFENAIYENLDKVKADRLLDLFKSSPQLVFDIEEYNKEIYSLLNEMSYKMTGTDLSDYENNCVLATKWREYYFNQHKQEYYKDINATKYNEKNDTQMNLSDLPLGDVDGFRCFIHENITKEEYDLLRKEDFSTYSLSFTVQQNVPAYFIKEDPETKTRFYLIGDEIVSENDLESRGYIPNNFVKTSALFTQDIENLHEAVTPQNKVDVEIVFKDGSVGYLSVTNGDYSEVLHKALPENIVIESLASKFPEQVYSKDYKDIQDSTSISR